MEEIIIDLNNNPDQIRSAKAGQTILLCGDILSARDAAHKRISELLASGKPLPVDVRDKLIYYLG
ncbi:MAG: fumarate hydratase C-terminal domain-containing protein, partial [Spirochaetales bacterium]|nr:fumarate hydratase C-terminal domain-containing protein [Spirochaetales bacterium]